MLLSNIFNDAPDIEIKNLMSDSRKKSRDGLFFCLKGMVFDGHRFVNQAIEQGAIAIVHSDDLPSKKEGIVYIQVKDVLKALNQVAHTFYEKPSSKMDVYGVTGTNGKSTTASLIHYLNSRSQLSGYVGTISIEYADIKRPALLTTPDAIDTHRIFADMVKANVKSAAIEVSSIGLEQRRVDTVNFNVGVFTNLTHDHLDYHGNMENYFIAKAKLFELLPKNGLAVINLDDDYGKRLVDYTNARVLTYGEYESADYIVDDIELHPKNSTFKLIDTLEDKEYTIATNLVAKFNVLNLTAALIAVSHQRKIPMETLIDYCQNIPQVEGRMEVIHSDCLFTTIVDFAHTPDGFIQCFEYAKSITNEDNRIIVVFGSAGKRDTKKRHVLGEIADLYCDMIILTEEDQRNEDVLEICNQIKRGIKNSNTITITDRASAIRQAISLANSNDTVLILGKGDETYLDKEFGKEYYLGDHKIAKQALDDRLKQKEQEENEPVY